METYGKKQSQKRLYTIFSRGFETAVKGLTLHSILYSLPGNHYKGSNYKDLSTYLQKTITSVIWPVKLISMFLFYYHYHCTAHIGLKSPFIHQAWNQNYEINYWKTNLILSDYWFESNSIVNMVTRSGYGRFDVKTWKIDTGHFFHSSLAQCLNSLGII